MSRSGTTIGSPARLNLTHIARSLASAKIAVFDDGVAIELGLRQLQYVRINISPTVRVMAVLLRQRHGIAHMTCTAVVCCQDKVDAFLAVADVGEGLVEEEEITHGGLDIALGVKDFAARQAQACRRRRHDLHQTLSTCPRDGTRVEA